MQKAYLDFETASALNINDVNASVYSNHPSTIVLCAVILQEDDSKLEVTDFHKDRLLVEAALKDKLIVAHSAIFEQLIYQNILVKKFGYSPLPVSRFRCTRAKGQAHSLPGKLEKMAEALNLLEQKDMAGKKLMLRMCRLDGPRDEASFKRLLAYCNQDNITARGIDKYISDLPPFEQKVWELDQEINHRGIRVDKPLIKEIIGLVDDEKQRLTSRFEYLVQGQISSPRSSVGLKKFLQAENFDIRSVDAKAVKKLLAIKDLPDDIREILEIRKTLAKSSTAKYRKILDCLDSDDRVRDTLVYHGAGPGRWSGQGAQFHNLPRPMKGFDVEYALQSIDTADASWSSEYGSVNSTASSLIRSVLIPCTNKAFIGGDYAGIEARITPWIAGQESTLDIFRRNEDIYLKEASNIYGKEITEDDKEERQVGKCAVLGLGYQGGIAAFHKMCTIYSVSLDPIAKQIIRTASPEELDKAAFVYSGYLKDAIKADSEHFNKDEGMCADIIKQRWRANNPKIVGFWDAVNREAMAVVQSKYVMSYAQADLQNKKKLRESDISWQAAPNLSWVMEGDFLYCILPSGRKMAYYKPKVESLTNKFGVTKETLTYFGIDPNTKQLFRERTYGGKLTENIVQAIARDIMVEGMFNIKNYGLDIVLTVHDEILSEGEEQTDLKEVEGCFTKPIKWAPGLPLAAEVWKGYRYRK